MKEEDKIKNFIKKNGRLPCFMLPKDLFIKRSTFFNSVSFSLLITVSSGHAFYKTPYICTYFQFICAVKDDKIHSRRTYLRLN